MSIIIDGTNGLTMPDGNTIPNGVQVADPYWNYRISRFDFNGATGDKIAVDYGQNQLQILTNGATLSNTVVKYGSSSLLCTGNSALGNPQANVVQSIAVGTNNFTLEGWAYPTSFTSSTFPGVFDFATSTTARVAFYFSSATNGVLRLDSTNNNLTLSTIGISLSTWFHWCAERVGTTLTFYINGVSAFSTTYSTNITSAYYLYIGSTLDGYAFAGNIDDVRLTIGRTVYGAAFTPPTAALPIGKYNITGIGSFN